MSARRTVIGCLLKTLTASNGETHGERVIYRDAPPSGTGPVRVIFTPCIRELVVVEVPPAAVLPIRATPASSVRVSAGRWVAVINSSALRVR